MSTERGDRFAPIEFGGRIGSDPFRLLAIGGVAVLTASYVSVLRGVTTVVGGTESLMLVVAGMIVAATILAYTIRPRTAAIAAAIVVVLGVDTYLEAAGVSFGAVTSASDEILADAITFATGLPIVRMVEAGTWTLAFAPGPVFLSWYFVLRERYVLSVVPGGFALCFLVLTGDAGTTVTLLGTLGAIATIGFGELDRRDASIAQADVLAIAFAIMIVLSMSVAFVGGGGLFGEADPGTLEGTLDASPERSTVGGSVDLSPEVRFTVESSEPSYWRTGVYDRFTGEEWVRSGGTQPYDGPIGRPSGDTDRLRHTVTMESTQEVMPVAPQPVSIDGSGTDIAEVSEHGQVHPGAPLIEGDSYTVESAVLDADPAELERAGTDYPDEIEAVYLQTPESTSNEFEEYTETVVADADTPYEKAVTIESFLRESKEYSLEVDRPSGDVAEAFLFEMDEGYCVYFATTMTQMLRSEGVPARYVTGYTEGQRVDDDEWVVRGTDAHAWVEVYFPDQGWVAFDPTPGERDAVHEDALQQAREDGVSGVDTDRSEDVPIDGTDPNDPNDPGSNDPGSDDPNDPNDPGSDDPNDPNDPNDPGSDDPNDPNDDTDPGNNVNQDVPDPGEIERPDRDDGGALPWLSPERTLIGLVLLVGLVAGARRSGVTSRASREARLYWHGSTGTPERDARRAYRRLEILLARRYRPRRSAESVREYVDALSADEDLDPRVRAVARRYERATYGGRIDREAADESIEAVDALARERVPLLGRRRS